MNEINPWYSAKSQDLRILDVVALGPFMIWFGATAKGVPEWARAAMIISGIATITYNGANMLAYREYVEQQLTAPPADV